MTDEQISPTLDGPTRRTALRTAAWTVPAVSVATAAPAWATSGGPDALLLVQPTSRRINSTQPSAAERPIQVRLVTSAGNPRANTPVQFNVAVTGDTWDIFFDGAGASNGEGVPSPTATVTTDSLGYATTSYGYIGRPVDPAVTRATFLAQSGDTSVNFVVGQLSLSALKLSAFCQHSLAIAEGRVVGWGVIAQQGRLGTGAAASGANSAVPVYANSTNTQSSLTGKEVRDVSPGGTHSLAVDTTGVVHAWGGNSAGEAIGVSTPNVLLLPRQMPSGSSLDGANVVEVAAGGEFSVARDSLGRVHTWGANGTGQLGRSGAAVPALVDLPVAVTKIAAGRGHALALGTDGKVYAWGSNATGQLGDGNRGANVSRNSASPVLTRVDPRVWTSPTVELAGIVDIAAGTAHTLAVDSAGRVWACGSNSFAQMGGGTSSWPNQTGLGMDWPTAVSITHAAIASKKVVKVAAGHAHSLCLTDDGQVYGWGQNTVNQLGAAAVPDAHALLRAGGGIQDRVIEGIAAGDGTSFAKDSKGIGYAWGWQDNGRLGNGVVANLGAAPAEVDVASLIP